MFLLELINRFLKLYLSSPQWMYLHKLLQIEERLRYAELITASRCSQEVFELIPIGQLEYYLVYLPQGFRVNVLEVFSLQYRL